MNNSTARLTPLLNGATPMHRLISPLTIVLPIAALILALNVCKGGPIKPPERGDDPKAESPEKPPDRKKEIWDVLLYNTSAVQSRQSERDVTYSYPYNGNYSTIDHIFVSQEFYCRNPDRVGEVEDVHFLNDHIVDGILSTDDPSRIESDHGQIVATLRIQE